MAWEQWARAARENAGKRFDRQLFSTHAGAFARWLCLLLFCAALPAHAAYQWLDSFGKSWSTAQEACVFGEFHARLDAKRAANPSVPYRIGALAIQAVDDTEVFCQGDIQRRFAGIWLTDELIATSDLRIGAPDPCNLPGYADAETGLCGSPKCHGECTSSGCNGSNPINTASGNKFQRETDYVDAGKQPIVFERYYNSRDLAAAGLGTTWRHTYSRALLILDTGDANAFVKAIRHDGRVIRFGFAGGVWRADADVAERLVQSGANWVLTSLDDARETYDAEGRLLSIADRAGQTITLSYANGKLQSVRNAFNRVMTFTYDGTNRLAGFNDPDNRSSVFGYDASGRLASVTRPGGALRRYLYNEPANTGGADLPNALTGIIDETAQRFATFTYDDQGRATSSRHGADPGVGRYQLAYNAGGSTTVTDPLGTARTFNQTVSFGVARLAGVTQPCAACGAGASQSLAYDANGNLASRIDFNGNRTNYEYDLTRNVETRRIEALASGGASTASTRTITTEWHPAWRLPKRVAEPKRLTTYLYSGDSDGGSTVSCGATGALCRLHLQATTDVNGAAGFAAAPTGSPQVWDYTYNAQGQRLTADGPRTDAIDRTTYTYYADTIFDATQSHTLGDLWKVTNAAGQVTEFLKYDRNGAPLQIKDPNGLITTLSYTPRGWLKTRQVGAELTTYEYDAVGQLKKVTHPDASFLAYTYDDAHRLTGVSDGLGNSIRYTLDAMGNRTQEQVLDPGGALVRTQSRVYDALNRLQNLIGAR